MGSVVDNTKEGLIKSIVEKHKIACKDPAFDLDEFTNGLTYQEKVALQMVITDAALRAVLLSTLDELGG